MKVNSLQRHLNMVLDRLLIHMSTCRYNIKKWNQPHLRYDAEVFQSRSWIHLKASRALASWPPA